MKESIRLEITTEAQAKVAAALLEAMGIKEPLDYIKRHLRAFGVGHWPWLVVEKGAILNATSSKDKYYGPLVTIAQLADLAVSHEPAIMVGEYVVEFKEGGIQVGCTFVPTETVDAIHAKLHA